MYIIYFLSTKSYRMVIEVTVNSHPIFVAWLRFPVLAASAADQVWACWPGDGRWFRAKVGPVPWFRWGCRR